MANIQFQLRRGISSEWTSVNPILAAGEVGVETDTNKIKIGNGNSGWTSLSYAIGGASGASGITGPYVTTFNGLTGTVGLSAGTGINISTSGNTLTIFATGFTFTQFGTGAVSRTLDSKLKDSISVKDFGAVGNGSTDDTAAIQAALTAAAALNGTVYVPATSTSYKITDALTIPDKVSLFGDGYGSCLQGFTANRNLLICGNSSIVKNLRLKMPSGITLSDLDTQNAVFVNAKSGVKIENNFIELVDSQSGICTYQSRNILINGNFIYGGNWNRATAPVSAAGVSDIVIYGTDTVPGTLQLSRYTITNNFCFSNNSQGIYVDQLGANTEFIIQSNQCITLDPATCTIGGAWTEMPSGTLTRRHGIVVGYNTNTVDGPRAIVANNICRNTIWTGIYLQSGATSNPGPVLVTGNMCSRNGYESGHTSGLQGGIWLSNLNSNTVITGNVIDEMQRDNTGAIMYIPGAISTTGPSISNNYILNSLGYGIFLTNLAANTNIVGNTIVDTVKHDIYHAAGAGQTGVGGMLIENNTIKRVNYNYESIFLDQQSGTVVSTVRNNYIKGYDKLTGGTTANDTLVKNAGIKTNRNSYVRMTGNIVDNFHVAISFAAYWAASTRYFDADLSNNTIRNCTTGFGMAGSTSGNNAPIVPVCGNVFDGVTNKISANTDASAGGFLCGYIARKDNNRLVVLDLNAIPTVSTWAVGDRVEYTTPTAGGFLGAVCTTAGSPGPGTWIQEGILSSSLVYSISGLTGTVGLSAGTGINISTSGNTLSLFATTGITFTQTGTGFFSRTIDSIFKDTLSVKDFGAVGDGITNDTAAIQNALNAGASGCVYFPQGTYKITAGLTVSANTTLRADPRKAIINVQPFSPAPILGDTGSLNYNNGFVINGDDVIFDGLWIKGSNEAKYRNEPLLTPVPGATGIQWRTDEYAAAIKATKKNNIVVQNCTIEQFGNGIFFNGGNNYKIIDNFFFGGRQIGAPNRIANTHSIWMNGSGGASPNKGFRGIISRNHCLSNTDSAIIVAGEGGDADIIISENICEPFQLSGITATINLAPTPGITLINDAVNPTDPILTDPTCNKSRYPIVVSYSGDWPSRIIVSNNIVRNGGANGIYANSGAGFTAPGSEVVITGNIVTSCGFDLLQPGSASLKGGIWINSNGGKTVTGNLITDCAGYGINVIGPEDDVGNTFSTPVISGNSILRTVLEPINSNAGWGIAVTGTTVHGVLISSNRIYNSATDGIYLSCSGISSGNCQINDNLITHGTSGYTGSGSGITVIVGTSSQDCFVANNKIMGRNNVDSNGGRNAGIWIQGRVHCVGNSITRFHRGIESQFNGVRTTDVVCSNNTIKDTNYAITGQGTGPWLVSGNVFKNINAQICHAGPFQGTMVRASGTLSDQPDIIHVTSHDIPTDGIWLRGDYIKNTLPDIGSPKGWYCTASGTGTGATWVSEGALGAT